jgi:response regulator RpfG family c-di-GMP phosphodiesterase
MTDAFRGADPAQNSVERPRVLIVDDEQPLRRVLVRLMQADGFNCEEAGNGLEALAVLARHPVAIVVSDLHMPELDGIGLLREVRAKYPDTAVMLVSAIADVQTAVECLGEGAMDYVTKPFQLEEVRARVRQALDKRRLVLENRDHQERLEERVTLQQRRLEELFLASIQSLADALEVKDTYTHGHSLRVSRYSGAIARELGMDLDFVKHVELGGRVHDIGKIGVRESVLNKPGPLSEDEYRHIMSHPEVGWRILSPLLSEQPRALHIVRHHHERWDGRGLPDALAAENIPLEARIAAVADTFDAMTSERPYRPGVSMDATLAELQRCRGTQFDPAIVDAFMSALKNGAIDRETASAPRRSAAAHL